MQIILDKSAENILNTLNKFGFEAYAVGGCIRDIIMGREVTDYDITTSATPDEVKKVFSAWPVIETGIKHGTVTVMQNHIPYEITTYRTENGYSDSRHPDTVIFVQDIIEDLSRRDFTMNSIAFSPNHGTADPFCGIADINSRIIRAVGDPFTRFSEDALRILRALRFSATLGFDIEPFTAKAIIELAHTVKKVSPERIYAELKKLICGNYAQNVIANYRKPLGEVIPIVNDTFEISRLPNDFAMRLCYLCGRNVIDALNYLHSDNITKQKCRLLLDSTPLPADNIELKFYISAIGRENAAYVTAYRQALYGEDIENSSKYILESDTCLTLQDLAINGSDLIELGIRGEKIGKTLQSLLNLVISEKLENKKAILLEKAKSL